MPANPSLASIPPQEPPAGLLNVNGYLRPSIQFLSGRSADYKSTQSKKSSLLSSCRFACMTDQYCSLDGWDGWIDVGVYSRSIIRSAYQ
jgi:hypothetical protein